MIEDGQVDVSGAAKVPVIIEARLRCTSTACPQEVQKRLRSLISKRSVLYLDGPLAISQGEEPFLEANLEEVKICDTLLHQTALQGARLLFWQVELQIFVFQLDEEGPADTDGDDGASPSCCEWQLPSLGLHGLWDALIYDGSIKQRLLQYAATALHFGRVGVNSHLVSFNRTVLLHGPPGTGKTSLCKALAQKLAIRFSDRYAHAQLIEVNAHSLFSKWFSESGKLVTSLFARIKEAVEEEDTLVFVLIDEVESLTAARKAAVSGSEPADSIRAVNALLTALDSLRGFPNVMLLTTSNLTQAIDVAFIDRADIKAYLGPPGLQARYEILRSCLAEMYRTGIVSPTCTLPAPFVDLMPASLHPGSLENGQSSGVNGFHHEDAAAQAAGERLKAVAMLCEGFSGRSLRKLPFLAYVAGEDSIVGIRTGISLDAFLNGLQAAIEKEKGDRELMADVTS